MSPGLYQKNAIDSSSDKADIFQSTNHEHVRLKPRLRGHFATRNGEIDLPMNILLTIVVLLITGLAVWKLLRLRAKGVQTKKIAVDDIAKVYHQISTQAIETSFAVFIISPAHQDSKDSVEIQFSVEKGITGLDWILMSESNQREKAKVIQHALSKGAEWQECEMNNWIYLRINQGDVAELCTSLIKQLYGVDEVLLKYGGFRYR